MPTDYQLALWLLKLGALINVYFLMTTLGLSADVVDPHVVIPAQILFAVSAYRCLFPNRYKDNVVLHDTVLSSTLVTRVLATFVEVAWIYQFSHLIRLQNEAHVGWVDALSWLMVIQVLISQAFVWGAIVTGRLSYYFYEELGWGVIFAANTVASAYLYSTVEGLGQTEILLQLNLLFGLFYLPWQLIHVRALHADAATNDKGDPVSWNSIKGRLHDSLHQRTRATDADSWGGAVGLTWMVAYWASLIPVWVHQVVLVLTR